MATASRHASPPCPIAAVVGLVGDRWTLLIIRDLAQGTRRFGDLVASLDGISTRTLSVKLKSLEQCGLVERTAYHERPPRVEYALSVKGSELSNIIDAMRQYGERHLMKPRLARA